MATSKRLNYNHEEILADMKEVFFADGEFDAVEKTVFMGTKKIVGVNSQLLSQNND